MEPGTSQPKGLTTLPLLPSLEHPTNDSHRRTAHTKHHIVLVTQHLLELQFPTSPLLPIWYADKSGMSECVTALLRTARPHQLRHTTDYTCKALLYKQARCCSSSLVQGALDADTSIKGWLLFRESPPATRNHTLPSVVLLSFRWASKKAMRGPHVRRRR